ncbi:hypothetical protein CXU12_10710 [Akkermansia muciniphila]|nr:hypothetical protein CXU12_10710 [Akkermansia muciniphila]
MPSPLRKKCGGGKRKRLPSSGRRYGAREKASGNRVLLPVRPQYDKCRTSAQNFKLYGVFVH